MNKRGEKEHEEARRMFGDNYDNLEIKDAESHYELVVKYILILLAEFEKYHNKERTFTVKK